MLIGGAIAFAFYAAATWGIDRIDTGVQMQQRQVIEAALHQEQAKLGVEQDSAAKSDDAVLSLLANNQQWIASHLSEWTSKYFNHDRVYVIAPDGGVISAASQGAYAGKALDPRDAAAIGVLVKRLRLQLIPARVDHADAMTPPAREGLSDVAQLSDGALALIGIRPIVPTTVALRQRPGTESLLVSVKLINGPFLASMAKGVGIPTLRLAGPGIRQTTFAVRNGDGQVLGSIAWTPDRPALGLIKETAPATVGLLALAAICFLAVMVWLRRTTAGLRASRARTTFLAFHDPLTGLANRALFESCVRDAMAYEYLAETKVALISIDLDNFKEINDSLGHAAGDELIRQVANRLTFVLSEGATLARLGGDEFALVQPGVVSDGQVEWICASLVRAFLDPVPAVRGGGRGYRQHWSGT